MGKGMKIFLVLLLCLFSAGQLLVAQDSTHVIRVRDITPRENFLSKLKGELTFAPHYSAELGAGAAFAYVTPANVTVVGDIASQGYVLLGILGKHPVCGGKWSVDYKAYYAYAPTDFWGVGYINGSNSGNRGEYDRKRFLLQAHAIRDMGKHFHAGPAVSWNWIQWEGMQGGRTSALGYGVVAFYDTRDNVASPSSGLYIKAQQCNYTDFSAKPFYGTTLQFNAFREVWSGGVLAVDFLGQFTYGAVPWTMLPTIGGTERMRGYFRGRYMDNNAVSGQVELRQHIWEMIGGAVWVAGANVWGKGTPFNLHNSLPGAGGGLRLKLQGGTLLRFDFGFGKDGQNGFVFGINEAF